LREAAALLAGDGIEHVLVGGADSYVIDREYDRLDAAGRLRTEGTAQGLTPGEGAVFVLLARERPGAAATSLEILGTGDAQEAQSATSSGYSQGRALVAALRAAASAAGLAEASIDWVVSNGNGERYASWEALLARARYYRTRRERLIVHYPALSVGEIGAASGALALLMSAHGFARGYRAGSIAMIELASEGAGRAACVVRAVRRRDGS
jgi:3-oxoacyl-[acyl-carrier-protein] synthase-1